MVDFRTEYGFMSEDGSIAYSRIISLIMRNILMNKFYE